MSRKSIGLDEELHRYLVAQTLREPDVFRQLREETARLPNADMQISPEQGQFLGLLVRLIGVRRALEVGTFTGYSALWVASELPADGKLVACDTSEEWTAVARRYWEAAGVADKIDLRIGPGQKTLDQLIASDTEPFDFAFIDADKTGYDGYYEQALRLVRPGGLIAFDNALMHGRVADASDRSEAVRAVRALNERVTRDLRVTSSLVPIGDGLLLARKSG